MHKLPPFLLFFRCLISLSCQVQNPKLSSFSPSFVAVSPMAAPAFFLKWVFLLGSLSHSLAAAMTLTGSCHSADYRALAEFAGNLSEGSILSNWSQDVPCCSWDGVVCSDAAGDQARIVELLLSRRGLTGVLASSLSFLDRLEVLDLSLNALSGPIAAVGRMTALRAVNLSSNKFEGSLPDLAALRHLAFFNASNNSLAGLLQPDICCGIPEVQVLDLSANSFSGPLPTADVTCNTTLRELYLGFNSFSSDLPDPLFGLVALEKLSLASNNFLGQFGERLSKLSSLRTLIASGNRFSSSLPDVFGNLPDLEQLVAHSNLFNGTLPPSLELCPMLKDLDLRNNSFSGSIDLDFSKMKFLISLDLASNHFTGQIPVSLSKCQSLKTLSLAKNGLSGEVPQEFEDLSSLTLLSVSNNSFHNLSSALGILQQCKNLSTLVLTMNFLGEELPDYPLRFQNLEVLALGNCALSGQFPLWLRDCQKLQVLDLSWNQLTGGIPPFIGQLDNLIYLDISNNSLTGEIPKSLTQLKSLVSTSSLVAGISIGIPLYVKRNQSITGLQYNQLSNFPPSLYLNDNGFAGMLWPEFGNLKALHVLDLSNNCITGRIPDTLSEMSNLEVLDLSYNQLHGSIPASLSKLNFLSKFSVAHNNLQGNIPTGGQFFSFSNSSFDGNSGLCRSSTPCNKTQQLGLIPQVVSNKIGRNRILGITVSIGVGVAFLLAGVLFNMLKKDAGVSVDVLDEEHGSHMQSDSGSKLVIFFPSSDTKDLSINDLLKSTNNFDQSNIIGCGGFGLVYKAYLPDGTQAAIKRLSGDCGQMEREFRAEVEALSRAQHENLVSLKGYCRYGTDRLLIYSYMENGSLDYWLHERADGGYLLKWETRLKIAQGSARGLAYLHKICQPNIIHRDVKSSNILLDDKFEAHLADFGLSRLILPYDTHVTTELVGTLGYIPPEYSQTLIATLKGDVFSFGVVLLELLTGRRPVDVCKAKGCRDLVSWVVRMKTEKKEQIFDSVIWDKAPDKQLFSVLETACKCISPDPRNRPSIDQVVLWLHAAGSES